MRQFLQHAGEYPWNWTAAHLDDWSADLVGVAGKAKSTIRNYHDAIRSFESYLIAPQYRWAEECQARFGTHPVRICFESNTTAHLVDYEGDPDRRPMTREELQRFFDYADDRVDAAVRSGRKGALAAYRDATVFKVMYGWGLFSRVRPARVVLFSSLCSSEADGRRHYLPQQVWCTSARRFIVAGLVVESGHEFAVGGAGGGEVFVAFVELLSQVEVCCSSWLICWWRASMSAGGAEPGLAPGLFAERFGQRFSRCWMRVPSRAARLVGSQQVRLQRGPGDRRAGAVTAGWFGLQRMDLLQQVGVAVEECAVDSRLRERSRLR